MRRGFQRILPLLVIIFCVGLVSPAALAGSGSGRCRIHLLTGGEYFFALKDAIDGARHSIFMAMYLFKTSPYPTNRATGILHALERAARRGVAISVLLEHNDNPEDFINVENAKTGRMLQKAGARVYWDRLDRKLHIKVVVIDHHLIFLGSHNLTHSAMKYNQEMSLMVNDPRLANQIINTISRFPKTPFRAVK